MPPALPLIKSRAVLRLWVFLLVLLSFGALGQADTNLQPSIAALPHITKTKSGRAGDPINVGLVGSKEEVIAVMKAAGWYPADPVTMKTSLEITGSVVFHKSYKYAPVSPLFFQGRMQDLAFEKPDGKSAAHRHHVRFWKVLDQGAEGRPVWLGAGTYDKSVGLSHVNGKITHHISGDVDSEREIIVADLVKSMRLLSIYFVAGAGPVADARNGGGDHYHSDGMIHFAVISAGAVVEPNAPQNLSIAK